MTQYRLDGQPEPEAPDLHGIARQPFPDFAEMATYLERVNFPTIEEAIEFLDDYGMSWGGEPEECVTAIWMRHTTLPADLADVLGYDEQEAKLAMDEYTECWIECAEGASGAVPFWKDAE